MEAYKRLIYHSYAGLLKVYMRLFLDFHVWGRENIPPGPKIYTPNHIASTDPLWLLPVFTEPVHIVIGPGYQSKVLAWIFDRFEQINAMPQHRHTVVDQAVHYLNKGEAIYNAPEGDLSEPFQLGRFYPGVARMYRRSRAPIIPMVMVAPRHRIREWPFPTVVEGRVYRTVSVLRGVFCINVGKPFTPDVTDDGGPDEDDRIMDELKERMRLLVEDVRVNKFWLEKR